MVSLARPFTISRGRPRNPRYPCIPAAAAREAEAGAKEGILKIPTLDEPPEIVPSVRSSRGSSLYLRRSRAAAVEMWDGQQKQWRQVGTVGCGIYFVLPRR